MYQRFAPSYLGTMLAMIYITTGLVRTSQNMSGDSGPLRLQGTYEEHQEETRTEEKTTNNKQIQLKQSQAKANKKERAQTKTIKKDTNPKAKPKRKPFRIVAVETGLEHLERQSFVADLQAVLTLLQKRLHEPSAAKVFFFFKALAQWDRKGSRFFGQNSLNRYFLSFFWFHVCCFVDELAYHNLPLRILSSSTIRQRLGTFETLAWHNFKQKMIEMKCPKKRHAQRSVFIHGFGTLPDRRKIPPGRLPDFGR